MHDALAIANYFYLRGRSTGVRDLSPAKLHALVYCAHGWHLGQTGKPLFADRVSANRDGAFIPALREAGCWGTKALTHFVTVLRMDEARGVMVEQTPMLPAGAPVTTLLDWVWKNYGALSMYELARRLNAHGSPWDQVWNAEDRAGAEPRLVSSDTIRLWFQELRRGKHATTTSRKSETQRRKAATDKTQRLPTRPDPNRLRST